MQRRDFLGSIGRWWRRGRAGFECQSVDACGIGFVGVTEDGEVTDEYIPAEDREGQDWDFTLEIIPNAEQCFNALREREDE